MKSKKEIGSIILYLLLIILLTSCEKTESNIEKKAEELLSKYQYNIQNKPSYYEIFLGGDMFALYNISSKDIGLSLDDYHGKTVKYLEYKLKEQTQREYNNKKEIFADILFNDKNEIIGAFTLYPGHTNSLKDKSFIKPDSLNPAKLEFPKVNKVEVMGPEEDRNLKWSNTWVIPKNQINKLLDLLKNSVPQNNEIKSPSNPVKRYIIKLHYKDGPIVSIHFYKEIKKLTIDCISNWSYDCNTDLVNYISTITSSSPIKTETETPSSPTPELDMVFRGESNNWKIEYETKEEILTFDYKGDISSEVRVEYRIENGNGGIFTLSKDASFAAPQILVISKPLKVEILWNGKSESLMLEKIKYSNRPLEKWH